MDKRPFKEEGKGTYFLDSKILTTRFRTKSPTITKRVISAYTCNC